MELADGVHDFGDTVFHVKDGLLHRDDGGPAKTTTNEDGPVHQWYDHGFGLYTDPGPEVVTWRQSQLTELVELMTSKEVYYRDLDPIKNCMGLPSINSDFPHSKLMFYTSLEDLIKYMGMDDEAIQSILAVRYKYNMDFDPKVKAWYEKKEET